MSHCEYSELLILDYAVVFVADTATLMVFVVLPASIGFLLWRLFITNKVGPRAGITVLGLDDSSETYSPSDYPRLSKYLRFEYVLTGVLTFMLGVVAFEVI